METLLAPGTLVRCVWPGPVRLQVLRGRVWLTQAGQLEDHFLEAGAALDLPAGQPLLLGSEGTQPLQLQWQLLTLPIDYEHHRRLAHHLREQAIDAAWARLAGWARRLWRRSSGR